MNKFLLIIASVFMIAFSSCNKEDGSVYGTVSYAVKVSEDGTIKEQMKPASGATVRIYKGYTNEGSATSGLKPIGTVTADANGNFKFGDLDQGNYYLTAFVEVTDTFAPNEAPKTVKLSNGAFNTISTMVVEGQSVRKDITVSEQ